MTPLYARVFTQILDSSLAEDWQARHVFEDLLKLADNGVVDMTRQAIVRRTNIPADVVDRAITKLEAPDTASRDPGEDGRRIVRLDDHRDWGWLIVNWQKYEAIKRAEDQRLKTAERTRRWRDRQKPPSALPQKPETTTDSDSDSDTEAASPNHFTPSHGVTPPQSGARKERAAGAAPASESDADWLAGLVSDQAYQGIDVPREHAKMLRWCTENKKQPSRRRFINWLNRTDKPMTAPSVRTVTKHVAGIIQPT